MLFNDRRSVCPTVKSRFHVLATGLNRHESRAQLRRQAPGELSRAGAGRSLGVRIVAASPVFPEKHIGGGKRLVLPYYSTERRAELLKMLLAPLNLSMDEASRREEVSEMPLSNWRKQLRSEGNAVSENKPLTENWSAKTKFAVVL